MSKKTDQEFLEHYCKSADTIFNHARGQMIYIKNQTFDIVYTSTPYQETLETHSTEADATHITTEEQEQLKKDELTQDDIILNTRVAKNYIYVDSYRHIRHLHKRPIVNPDTQNAVGIMTYVNHFALPNILKLIYKVNNVNHGLANKIQKAPLKYELTEKQNMVLFLYVNKYSNVEISQILTTLGHKTSPSRVNDHLESLKFIFYVKTKEQLIEKAISLNYHLLVPRNFLKYGIYELLDEAVITE